MKCVHVFTGQCNPLQYTITEFSFTVQKEYKFKWFLIDGNDKMRLYSRELHVGRFCCRLFLQGLTTAATLLTTLYSRG